MYPKGPFYVMVIEPDMTVRTKFVRSWKGLWRSLKVTLLTDRPIIVMVRKPTSNPILEEMIKKESRVMARTP